MMKYRPRVTREASVSLSTYYLLMAAVALLILVFMQTFAATHLVYFVWLLLVMEGVLALLILWKYRHPEAPEAHRRRHRMEQIVLSVVTWFLLVVIAVNALREGDYLQLLLTLWPMALLPLAILMMIRDSPAS